MIANGASLAYIKDQLGHSSIKVTVDTYGKYLPDANRETVDLLDERSAATKRNLSATIHSVINSCACDWLVVACYA
jgi:hypothetical protein